MGETAYEAYRGFSFGKSLITGVLLPDWERLPDNIKGAWEAAASAVYHFHVKVN